MQQSLAVVLHELVGLLDRSGEAILRQATGISYRQFYLLSAMARLGPSTQRDLAEFVGHSDAAISRMMTTLRNGKLVTSEIDGSNRRSKTVAVTPAGLDLATRAEALLERELSDLLAQRDVDEQRLTELAVGARDALRGVGWTTNDLAIEVLK